MNLHVCERAAPPPALRNVDFVANTSILDQISLVPKADRTRALPDFAFGSLINTVGMDGSGLVA